MDAPQNPEALLASAETAAQAQRRRVAEVRAREHVGAAGWAQSSTLEAIIRAGQEGLIATSALRQVAHLTGEQMRGLPLGATPADHARQAETLRAVLDSGQQQLDAAHTLNDLVYQALEDVTRTPVAEVSVERLKDIQARVQRQVEALTTIIASAQAHADTLTQVGQLNHVLAEHQRRVATLRELSASSEAAVLAQAGEQIVQRIGDLDEAAPQQIDALKRIGEAVVDKVADTGAAPHEQAQALEQLAQAAQEKSEQLKEG